jgi:hypothetical protein
VAIVLQDRVADGNALVAYVSTWIIAWRRYQLPDNILALMTEGTAQRLVGTGAFHRWAPEALKIAAKYIYTGICCYYLAKPFDRQRAI